jgi:RHS repeat-associated protein
LFSIENGKIQGIMYDRDSNRLSRTNAINSLFSESYQYDALNRLTNFTRSTHSQNWSLDAVGNWKMLTTDGGTPQNRMHNVQNQITSIDSGLVTPTYDKNGNTTQDETGKGYVYDAWNRLVAVKTSPSGSTLVSYTFDGLNRRVTETDTVAHDLYYSDQWQVLEEREGTLVRKLEVWSPVYVDAMVLRYRDTSGRGSFNETLYVQQDANFNVTALTSSGYTVERYVYDPYGPFSVLFGEVMNADWSPRASTAYSWVYFHHGGRYDSNSGLYQFRNRDYSPTLGRWMQQDPIRYRDGTSLYRYVHDNPTAYADPSGLAKICCVVDEYPKVTYAGVLKNTGISALHKFVVTIKLETNGTKRGDDECSNLCCDFRQLVQGYGKIDGVKQVLRGGGGQLITEDGWADDGYSWANNETPSGPDKKYNFKFTDRPGYNRLLRRSYDVDWNLSFKAQVIDTKKKDPQGNPLVVAEKTGYWVTIKGKYVQGTGRELDHGGFDARPELSRIRC